MADDRGMREAVTAAPRIAVRAIADSRNSNRPVWERGRYPLSIALFCRTKGSVPFSSGNEGKAEWLASALRSAPRFPLE